MPGEDPIKELPVYDAQLSPEMLALAKAARGGDVGDLQHACNRLNVSPANREAVVKMLREACRNGHREAAEWLAAAYAPTTEEVCSGDNYILYCACAHGHLEVAQWLVETYGITAGSVRKGINILGYTCGRGHLEVAQWLVKQFGLTAADVLEAWNTAVQYSCETGRINVLEWLDRDFDVVGQVKRRYGRAAVYRMLNHSSGNGHHIVAHWIRENFRLTDAEYDQNVAKRQPLPPRPKTLDFDKADAYQLGWPTSK